MMNEKGNKFGILFALEKNWSNFIWLEQSTGHSILNKIQVKLIQEYLLGGGCKTK